MWPSISVLGPSILIPGVFVGQKISGLHDPAQIAQTIAFSILFVSFAVLFFSKPWLSLIPGVAALAYWNMLRDEKNVEIYRYLDWAITTPMMLLAILVANNGTFANTVGLIVFDLIMVASGYLATIEKDELKKKIYFALGCLVFLPILWTLVSLKKAKYAVYLTLATWILYPMVWYADEEKKIHHGTSAVAYAAMDVITKVGLVNLLRI